LGAYSTENNAPFFVYEPSNPAESMNYIFFFIALY